MRIVTELFKDGDAMAIRTNAINEKEFIDSVSNALSALIDEKAYATDWEFQFGYWLPQVVDITCKLRGYKADVHEERVLTAGWISPSPSARVAAVVDREATVEHPGFDPRDEVVPEA